MCHSLIQRFFFFIFFFFLNLLFIIFPLLNFFPLVYQRNFFFPFVVNGLGVLGFVHPPPLFFFKRRKMERELFSNGKEHLMSFFTLFSYTEFCISYFFLCIFHKYMIRVLLNYHFTPGNDDFDQGKYLSAIQMK